MFSQVMLMSFITAYSACITGMLPEEGWKNNPERVDKALSILQWVPFMVSTNLFKTPMLVNKSEIIDVL